MKILTLNFLTCAVKACKSSSDSFPLHPKDAELAQDEVELNPQLLTNILHRVDWTALRTTATEVVFPLQTSLPPPLCGKGFGTDAVDSSGSQNYQRRRRRRRSSRRTRRR